MNGDFPNEHARDAFGKTASAYCRELIERGLVRDAILGRLVQSGKCHNQENALVIYNHVTSYAKKMVRPRRHVRSKPGDVFVECPLSPVLMERLQKAADARDVEPKVLAHRILATVLRDDLIAAVIDDGSEAAA